MKQAQVSDVLDDLIEVCREQEACYKACAQLLHQRPRHRALKRRAHHAARACRQLIKLREAMGDRTCKGSELAQTAIMSDSTRAFGAMSDEASALGMCERLGAIALMRYRDALDFELPEPVRRLLQRQFDAMLAQHASDVAAKQPRPAPEREVRVVLA